MSSVKEELARLVSQQLDDSSAEEIVRERALYVMIQRGVTDSDAGRVISNDDMAHRIRQLRE